jgi:Helix-turn-helix domain
VIGRHDQVKPFELIRWARQQAREHQLKALEAHVLLVLATYANKDGIAWPSLKTLALDCGLKPRRRETKAGRVYYTNTSISEALSRLADLQLVWTRQGGNGRPARRELLFNPARSHPASRTQPPRPPEQNYQVNGQPLNDKVRTAKKQTPGIPGVCEPPSTKAGQLRRIGSATTALVGDLVTA